MKAVLVALILAFSSQAFAFSSNLTCFDVNSGESFKVTYNPDNFVVELTNLLTNKKILATTDIFSNSGDLPLFLSTELLDTDGRAMLFEACGLNPNPKGGVVNAMIWAGKANGLTPVAERCLTCGK